MGDVSARKSAVVVVAAAVVALIASLAFARPAEAADPVPLGVTDTFGVLAGQGITNTGDTTVNGDVGSFPNTSIDMATLNVTGTNQMGGDVTQQAKTDLVAAYLDAEGQGPPTIPIVASLGGGQPLTPGVYNSASQILVTGDLTLAGDASSIFVFQAGSDLTVSSNARILLTGGVTACNVYWQVTSSATLNTNSLFRGTIMALTSIFVRAGVTVDGRLLARNGEVTLDNDLISVPDCDDEGTTSSETTDSTTTESTTTTSTTGPTATSAPGGTVPGGPVLNPPVVNPPVLNPRPPGTPGGPGTPGAPGTPRRPPAQPGTPTPTPTPHLTG
jgi:hypothetical protein